jgi:hypothetical protein
MHRPTAEGSQQDAGPGGSARPPVACPRQSWSRLPNLIEDDAANRRPQGRCAPPRGGLRPSLTAATRSVTCKFRPGRRNGATSRTKKRDHDDGLDVANGHRPERCPEGECRVLTMGVLLFRVSPTGCSPALNPCNPCNPCYSLLMRLGRQSLGGANTHSRAGSPGHDMGIGPRAYHSVYGARGNALVLLCFPRLPWSTTPAACGPNHSQEYSFRTFAEPASGSGQ